MVVAIDRWSIVQGLLFVRDLVILTKKLGFYQFFAKNGNVRYSCNFSKAVIVITKFNFRIFYWEKQTSHLIT
jgi:hypothetical protein